MKRSAADFDQLWAKYRASRSLEDRNALVEAYLPFVNHQARRVVSSFKYVQTVETSDLVNDAIPALIKLLDAWDPSRGVNFTSYAAKRLTGAMQDALRGLDWVPRLERSRLAKNPEHPIVRIFPLKTRSRGDEMTPGDNPEPIASQNPTQFDEDQWWKDMCRGLRRRERLILMLYYRRDMRMKQIGQNLGLSESRVSQMMSQIIQFIRERDAADELKAA